MRISTFITTFVKRLDMVIEFDKEYLSELYFNGRTSDKKHRFQPQVIQKYKRVVDTLESVDRVEDLFRYNSLNYEVLSGKEAGIESVRVDSKYRVEFKSRIVSDETIVTICRILELSNHYK